MTNLSGLHTCTQGVAEGHLPVADNDNYVFDMVVDVMKLAHAAWRCMYLMVPAKKAVQEAV